MRILFVSPFPYSNSSAQGGAQICSNAIKILSESNSLGVICFSNESKEENKAFTEMSGLLSYSRFQALQVSKLKVLFSKIISLFTANPEHALYFKSKQFKSLIVESIEEFKPEIVICQFPQVAQYLPFIKPNILIQDVQDAFSVSWYRRYTSTSNFFKRYYAKKQWLNWVSYESRYYKYADECWTLSDQDKFGLLAFNPSLNVTNIGLPLFSSVQAVNKSYLSDSVVGFLGSYSHPPNVESLEFIIHKLAPKLPNITFLIAGRNPPVNLVKQAGSNIKFSGFIEDLKDFYDGVSVVIAPLLSGGGVKIKVAEALSYGKAVVTTSIGADGLDYKNNNMLIVANDLEGFGLEISQLIEDKTKRNLLEQAALDYAGQFSFERWHSRVLQRLQDLSIRVKRSRNH